jgi:hypothetical protein
MGKIMRDLDQSVRERNVAVEWLAFLLRIREVPNSNTSPDTGYSN